MNTTTDHDTSDRRALISDRDLDALARALIAWEVALDCDEHDDNEGAVDHLGAIAA